MVKPFYKAIILVLASDNNPLYKEFRKIYQEYLDIDPEIKVFLVYGNQFSVEKQSYDLVYDDIPENYYPGMILKTIRALEDIDNNFDYDFLVRTNLSTFWDIPKLKERLDRQPKKNCLTGSLRRCRYKNKTSPDYIGGINLVLSRDLVKKLIDYKDEVSSWDLPEDWAISQMFINLGLMPRQCLPKPMHLMEHHTEYNEKLLLREIELAKSKKCDNYRIKSKTSDRLTVDIGIAKLLLKEIYNKVVVN